MSTKSRHNGLSSDDRSQIRSAILSSREMLESEFERQLERYGVYDDDRVPLSKLGHLSLQDRETRREIDAALERELEATENYLRAYSNYIREATKEYLNRYVGLKTIEARGLVTETLTTKAEYGNRSYLHYTVDEIAGELTDASDDGLGVALDLAFQEIGAEIRILFEDTDYTAIEPEFTVRRDVFEELGELDDDAWAADEAIGWVYQYFGEKEREEIDERINNENYKVQDTDIATKTQLFTPRYIVEWLVDNSLGRLWLEMYGSETNIDDETNCFYLAPLEESLVDRKPKDVRDITVIDPACGSGHMLFYAFDVLYEMYLERSEVIEENIPREILKNNLYGIDIDPGAAQIAALALYVKAKSKEPDIEIQQINIASADAVLVNGEKKEEVLNRVSHDVEKRILEQVWRSFEHIREWGSLVRIEERIEEIIEEEREAIKASGQTTFTDDGRLAKQSSVVSFEAGNTEESWEQLKNRLLSDVKELAQEALEQNSPIDELFAGEVEKSVELLDLFLGDYDVVVTNPPYLSSRKMDDNLKKYIKDNYVGHRDLYTAFIERCTEFAGSKDYVSMVTPEGFMFLYTFRKLRAKLVAENQIVEGAHLSRYGFDQAKDSYTIPFILRKGDPVSFDKSRFYRMTHEQEKYETYEGKIKGLSKITKSFRSGIDHNDVYTVDQKSFTEIGRTPFVYWFGQEILDLFSKHEKIEDISDVKQGLATGDDDRFIRNWWELPDDLREDNYSWIMMSGNDDEYYYSTEKTVHWENDGEAIKNYDGSRPQNLQYYGKPGITFRDFGNYFTARIQPEDYFFTTVANFIYPNDISRIPSLLGYLNSSLARFMMNGINPTLHFKGGDAQRLPVKDLENHKLKIEQLVDKAINLRKEQSRINEVKNEFDSQVLLDNFDQYNLYLDMKEADIQTIHGIIDSYIFEEYGIPPKSREALYENIPKNLVKYPHISNIGELGDIERGFRKEVPTKRLSDDEYESLISEIDEAGDDPIREVAEALEISPFTVAKARSEHDLYTRDQKREAAGKLLSYYIGCIVGRWKLDSVSTAEDGIVVFDAQFDSDIGTQIRECVKNTFENPFEIENTIEDLLNKDIEEWLKENFFRYHHCKEYRRRGQRIPIYWHLESDGGTFSCFVYYHSITSDTFAKIRGQYVDRKLQTLENHIESVKKELNATEGEQERELRGELEKLQKQHDDLIQFSQQLDALIDSDFYLEIEEGIWENIKKVDEFGLLSTPLDKL